MMMIISKLIRKFRSLRYYVIADPADNSITLSRHLFAHMRKEAGKSPHSHGETPARQTTHEIARTANERVVTTPNGEQKGHYVPGVFVFRIPRYDTYGFMLDHGIDKPTQLCQIQYNAKHRCVGFETLCPSVGRIFYDYGLPALRPVKLSVSVRRTITGRTYYELDLPTPKQIRLCKASSETHAKRT